MQDDSIDLIVGAEPLARFLNMKPRQVYRAAESGERPIFRLRGKLVGRRSKLRSHIEDLECQALRSNE